MSAFLPQASCPPSPYGALQPLPQFRKRDGTLYTRRADVEAQIAEMLSKPPEEWPIASLKSETLIYLIRMLWSEGDHRFVSPIFDCLGRRIARIVEEFSGGVDTMSANHLADEIAKQIVEIIFAAEITRKSIFLEVAFKTAVKRRTLNRVESHCLNTIRVLNAGSFGSDQSSDDQTFVLDPKDHEQLSPEEMFILEEDRVRMPDRLEKALNAVKDPRHREAMKLRLLGWPIYDKDPEIPTISKHFGMSDRQIQTWLKKATAEMQKVSGE